MSRADLWWGLKGFKLKGFRKLKEGDGDGGKLSEYKTIIQEYKTNSYSGLKCLLFVLNLEIYWKRFSLDHFWEHICWRP